MYLACLEIKSFRHPKLNVQLRIIRVYSKETDLFFPPHSWQLWCPSTLTLSAHFRTIFLFAFRSKCLSQCYVIVCGSTISSNSSCMIFSTLSMKDLRIKSFYHLSHLKPVLSSSGHLCPGRENLTVYPNAPHHFIFSTVSLLHSSEDKASLCKLYW